MQTSSKIWRRRVVLMLSVGLLIAVPVTLLVRDSGDDEPQRAERSLDERFPLNPTVGDTRIRASYQVPKGWTLEREGGGEVLILTAKDESVRIAITSPGKADATDDVLEQALGAIQATYQDVQISQGSGPKVGGLPASGALVTASTDNGDLNILVAVGEGKRRAYLVQVFRATSAKPRRVAEAQRFLNSLELEG